MVYVSVIIHNGLSSVSVVNVIWYEYKDKSQFAQKIIYCPCFHIHIYQKILQVEFVNYLNVMEHETYVNSKALIL